MAQGIAPYASEREFDKILTGRKESRGVGDVSQHRERQYKKHRSGVRISPI
jgi:hypothetical protein